jgi:hypothetical protein
VVVEDREQRLCLNVDELDCPDWKLRLFRPLHIVEKFGLDLAFQDRDLVYDH